MWNILIMKLNVIDLKIGNRHRVCCVLNYPWYETLIIFFCLLKQKMVRPNKRTIQYETNLFNFRSVVRSLIQNINGLSKYSCHLTCCIFCVLISHWKNSLWYILKHILILSPIHLERLPQKTIVWNILWQSILSRHTSSSGHTMCLKLQCFARFSYSSSWTHLHNCKHKLFYELA